MKFKFNRATMRPHLKIKQPMKMPDTKTQLKKYAYQLLKNSRSVTWFMVIVIIMLSAIFIQEYFLNTLSDVKVVNVLKNQVVVEAVDMGQWQRINKKLEEKKQPWIEDKISNNPFE